MTATWKKYIIRREVLRMRKPNKLDNKEKSTRYYVEKYVDSLKPNKLFQPREITLYIYKKTGRLPYDSTITRYLRKRREMKNDVFCADIQKSFYVKVV